jgi:hypothetical protein
VATNNTNTTITGTGTNFLTAFGTRGAAGTIAGAATTITGTNTLFLSQFAVGDMIGTNAKGYSRITAIASNTSLTIAAAIPGGDPSGTTPNCIENVWFQAASQTVQRINTITSDTVLNLPANSSATQSGVGAQIGVLPASQSYLMVWLATGNTGTGVYVSTQRTTPYGISGYTNGTRRIGALLYTGSVVMGFDQYGTSNERWYQIEESSADIAAILVLNAAANTGWTSVDCSGLLPPTATAADLCAILATGGVAGFNVFFRARARGSSTTSRSTQAALGTLSSSMRTMVRTALDGVQQYLAQLQRRVELLRLRNRTTVVLFAGQQHGQRGHLRHQAARAVHDGVRGLGNPHQGRIDLAQLQRRVELLRLRNRTTVVLFAGQQHGQRGHVAHQQ